VGLLVGLAVGRLVGLAVGRSVGLAEGCHVGLLVGLAVVGLWDGRLVTGLKGAGSTSFSTGLS
jgi:hypothetical protein